MEQIIPLLTVGAQFEMSECPFEVAGIRGDEVRIAPMLGGTMRHLKFKALADLMAQSQIKVTYQPPKPSDPLSQQLRCVFRAKPATDSEASRPAIPSEAGRAFRRMPATLLRGDVAG